MIFLMRPNSTRVSSFVAKLWKTRSAQLKPTFRYTDIIGALLVASQIFDQQNERGKKVMVVFSDMRHRTATLDLESHPVVPSFPHNWKRADIVVADLRGVRVYALGVDGTGRQIPYWQSLRQFWAEYFLETRADLRCFSVLRDPRL
jgi:hypothetical protein